MSFFQIFFCNKSVYLKPEEGVQQGLISLNEAGRLHHCTRAFCRSIDLRGFSWWPQGSKAPVAIPLWETTQQDNNCLALLSSGPLGCGWTRGFVLGVQMRNQKGANPQLRSGFTVVHGGTGSRGPRAHRVFSCTASLVLPPLPGFQVAAAAQQTWENGGTLRLSFHFLAALLGIKLQGGGDSTAAAGEGMQRGRRPSWSP